MQFAIDIVRKAEAHEVVKGLWTQDRFSYAGTFLKVNESGLPLKTVELPNPPTYAASRNPQGKRTKATVEKAVAKAEKLKACGELARYYKSAVSGLGAYLVGTPELITERICAYGQAGLDFMLLQSNPMEEGFDRFLSDVLPRVNQGEA